jgi:hypothetical protein
MFEPSGATPLNFYLQSFSSESQFLSWYDDVILEKNVVKNDLMTFGEAVAKVEQEYWDGRTKRRQQRDRSSISGIAQLWYAIDSTPAVEQTYFS